MSFVTKNKFYLIWILAVLLMAVLLRVWKLGEVPVSLYWDEIAMLVDAKFITQTGMDMSGNNWFQIIYPSYGDYKLAPYLLISSLFVNLPIIPEAQIRLLSVFVGIASMFVSSFLGYVLFSSLSPSKRKALFLAIFTTMAFSPWSIVFSRTAFEGHLAQLVLSTSILVLLISKNRWHFYAVSGVLGGLAVSTYYSALYVWPLVVLAGMAFIILTNKVSSDKLKISKKSLIKNTVILMLFFVISILPLVLSPNFENMQKIRLSSKSVLDPTPFVVSSRNAREYAESSVFSKAMYTAKIYQLKQMVAQYSENISPSYLFLKGDANLRHGVGYGGLFSIACFPVLILGLYYGVRRFRAATLFLVFWWLTALIPASIPVELPHALRSLNALTPLVILIGLGWTALFYHKKTWSNVVFLGLAATFITQTGFFVFHYFTVYPKLSASSWQDGYKQLAIEVSSKSSTVDKVWLDHPDGRFFLWYTYYGDVPPRELQQAKKNYYEPESLGNVNFQKFPEPSLQTQTVPIFLVGQTNTLSTELANQNRTAAETIQVPTTFGLSDMALFKLTASDLPTE